MFTFQNVIGNNDLIQNLKDSSLSKKLLHSYIFSGDTGLGKKLIAFSFVKLILCESPVNNDCCNKCSSCMTFETNNHPDVIFVESDKKSIGIDLVREKIVKNINIKPFKYKHKIFIIKNAHTMTIQAQNALLKIIEEPPKYAIFILITQNSNYFLPTILSRCVIFKLKPLKINEVENLLIEKQDIEPNMAKIYSNYAQGSMGRALKIATSQEFISMREEAIFGLKKLLSEDLISIYKFINKLEKYKENIQEVLDIFFLTYRDIMVYKNTNSIDFITQKDIYNIIVDMSNILSNKRAIRGINSILQAKTHINKNANFHMVMEFLFIKLKEK